MRLSIHVVGCVERLAKRSLPVRHLRRAWLHWLHWRHLVTVAHWRHLVTVAHWHAGRGHHALRRLLRRCTSTRSSHIADYLHFGYLLLQLQELVVYLQIELVSLGEVDRQLLLSEDRVVELVKVGGLCGIQR